MGYQEQLLWRQSQIKITLLYQITISLADDKVLTFTFPEGNKNLRFTDGSRSFYTVDQGFNYADAVQNVTENIPQATIIKIDSEAIWNKMDDADYGWNLSLDFRT